MKEPTVGISFEAADRITYDTLLFYRDILVKEIKQLSKSRDLSRHKQDDLDQNRLYLMSIEKVLEYFRPIE